MDIKINVADIKAKLKACEDRRIEIKAVGNSLKGVWKDFYEFCKAELLTPAPETAVTPIEEVVEEVIEEAEEEIIEEVIPEVIEKSPEEIKEQKIAEIKKKAMEEINNL